jgi:hypothetical protein
MMIEIIANNRRRWISNPAVLKTIKLPIQTMNRTTARIRNIVLPSFFASEHRCTPIAKKLKSVHTLPVDMRNTGR